jgi:hypothetical protein
MESAMTKLKYDTSTREIASLFGVKHRTVLLAHHHHKGYMGLRPIKLPNGQLRWSREEAVALLGGTAK